MKYGENFSKSGHPTKTSTCSVYSGRLRRRKEIGKHVEGEDRNKPLKQTFVLYAIQFEDWKWDENGTKITKMGRNMYANKHDENGTKIWCDPSQSQFEDKLPQIPSDKPLWHDITSPLSWWVYQGPATQKTRNFSARFYRYRILALRWSAIRNFSINFNI